MQRALALLLLLASGCAADRSAFTHTGVLNTGTLVLTNESGKIEAFPPAAGEPKNRYTISVTSADRAFRTVELFSAFSKTLQVCPGSCPPRKDTPAADYLIRVPAGVHARLTMANGDIDVSDVNAPVDAEVGTGDIKIQIPSYANARAGNGNVAVTFGDANWPGTLHFSTGRGDVELYVPAVANAHVDLHTDRGTVFTDFDLRGTSRGMAETIVGNIGSGGDRSVVVRVANGNVRLLKLVPQM